MSISRASARALSPAEAIEVLRREHMPYVPQVVSVLAMRSTPCGVTRRSTSRSSPRCGATGATAQRIGAASRRSCSLSTSGRGGAGCSGPALLGPISHQPCLRMEREFVTTAQQLTEAEIARAERLRLSDLLTEHRNDIADACRDPRAAVALVALLLRMESM